MITKLREIIIAVWYGCLRKKGQMKERERERERETDWTRIFIQLAVNTEMRDESVYVGTKYLIQLTITDFC